MPHSVLAWKNDSPREHTVTGLAEMNRDSKAAQNPKETRGIGLYTMSIVYVHPSGVTEADVQIQIDHTGKPHQVRLQQQHDPEADAEEVVNAVVFIREAKNGPVPDQVQEEQHHGQRIVDTTAVVAF